MESENLPFPIVYYPYHYGTFFCFSKEKYDYDTLTMCACSGEAVSNFFQLCDIDKSEQNYKIELRNYFPAIILQNLINWDCIDNFPISFTEGICHKCNNITPALRYCHEMYGTKFIQYYGWYVNQTYLRLGIYKNSYLSEKCPKEFQEDLDEIKILEEMLSENKNTLKEYLSANIDLTKSDSRTSFWKSLQVNDPHFSDDLTKVIEKKRRDFSTKIENITRAELGFKNIGEGWVSETVLFQIVKRIFVFDDVIFHSKPAWLNGLEIDVYVPDQKIGFEYQGEQHYHPIDVWGGEDALEELRERDAQKIRLCKSQGIRLITIDYSESLTEDYIRELINSE